MTIAFREQRHDALTVSSHVLKAFLRSYLGSLGTSKDTHCNLQDRGAEALKFDEFFWNLTNSLKRDPSSRHSKSLAVQLTQRLRQSDAEIAKLREKLHLPSDEERVASMRSHRRRLSETTKITYDVLIDSS